MTADPDLWRWSVWGNGFSGGAVHWRGCNSRHRRQYVPHLWSAGVGADYRLTPATIAGFALAGGATSFNTYGLGSGHSDLFQAAPSSVTISAAVISALAYGWQGVTTDRSVGSRDHLQARFAVNSWSGRIKGGHRGDLGPAG